MSNRYTLADLRADLDKQYAPLVIDLGNGEVTLQNLLRIPEKARNQVFDLIDQMNDAKTGDDGQDIEGAKKALEVLGQILLVVTADGKGQALVDAIGDDMVLGMHVFQLWMEATQPGEAEGSPTSSTSTASA
jgi:hypothetical protein